MQAPVLQGIEINPKLVAAIFTETVGDILRVFCLFLNGDTHQFEVPLEENQGSLNLLFTRLDMLDKCSSAIVDQVVQGRIYAQDEKAGWMYTLLATEGSRSPKLQADMHRLPWKKVWTAKGTEILLLRDRWTKDYCFAVRAELTGGDLSQTLQQSKPLLHPVPPPAKRALPLATLTALFLTVGLFVGGAMWFQNRDKSPMPVRANEPKKSQAVAETNYFLLINREIQGPHSMAAVLELQRAGKVTAETLIRAEGVLDWSKLEALLEQTSPK